MNLFQKIILPITRELGFGKPTTGSRSYKAAVINRLNQNWNTGADNINQAIRQGMPTVRKRARWLWKNNSMVRGIRSKNRINVVGAEGFRLQMKCENKAGEIDVDACRQVEKGWKEWTKKENCTMARQLSFVRVQWLLMDQLIRDGEILFRMHSGGKNVNKFGFALELLETDLLDHNYNRELANGNAIIQGVEYNQFKEPVAFYFADRNIKDEASYSLYRGSNVQHVRVAAREIIFVYDPEHSNQFRGISHLAQVMIDFHNLDGYTEVAIINARVGAQTMGFIETAEGAIEQMAGDETDDDGNTIDHLSAGEIKELPFGKKFTSFDPDYPHEQFYPFVKTVLRMIASGLGLNYNSWIGDLESVNFSAMRSGAQDQQEEFLIKQALIREGVLIPVFEQWLKMALLNHAIELNASDFELLNKPHFAGRRWGFYDPVKDITAIKLTLESDLTTVTDELAKLGIDFNDWYEKRKQELTKLGELAQLKSKYGLLKEATPVQPVDPNADDNQDDNADPPTNGKAKKSLITKLLQEN